VTIGRESPWRSSCGITRRHWTEFANYAAARGIFLFVRGGKEAAIPWIERNFPGKPLSLSFLKVDPRAGLLFARTPSDQADLVIDGIRIKPFTSDYDLAAIVHAREFDYAATLASWTPESGSSSVHYSMTNPFTEGVRLELNRRLGGDRILHGTEAQRSGNVADKAETVIAFRPDGKAVAFEVAKARLDVELRDLLARIHPGQAHMFRQ
jgi:hypothetical protein